MSSTLIEGDSRTAYERWELGHIDASQKKPSEKRITATDLPTVGEVERINLDAHKQGYDAGYEEGTARVRMEAHRFHNLVEHLDVALNEFDQAVAEDLLRISIEIARRMVRKLEVSKPEFILEIVHEALQTLPHQHAGIHLHPEDAALVRSFRGDQLSHQGHRILEDPTIQRGGVLIEAGGSQVDGTVETRWKRVLDSIGASEEWLEKPTS